MVGLLLGKALWCLVPKEKLLDQNLLYLVALGTAFEKQKLGETNAALSNYMMGIKYCGTSPTNFVPMEAQIRERDWLVERLQRLQ